MRKKVYIRPEMEATDIDLNVQILAGSVQTSGLGGDDLIKDDDDSSGNSWDDAMSRHNVWNDEEW